MAVFVAVASAAVKGSDNQQYVIHRGEFFEDTHPAYSSTNGLFIAAPASDRAIAIQAASKGQY